MKKFPVCTPASYRTSSPYEPFYTQATIEDQEHDFRAIVYIKAKRTISLMERVSCRIVCWSDTRLLLSLSTPLLLWMWQFFSENLAISFTDSRWSIKTKAVKWEFLFNCFCFLGFMEGFMLNWDWHCSVRVAFTLPEWGHYGRESNVVPCVHGAIAAQNHVWRNRLETLSACSY